MNSRFIVLGFLAAAIVVGALFFMFARALPHPEGKIDQSAAVIERTVR